MSRENNKKIMCNSCGQWCGSGRKYCKSCRESKRKELKEESLLQTKSQSVYSQGHISNRYAKIRYHARHDYENILTKCEVCGYDKHVEICHIKPIKEFNEQATIKEINDRKNIIGLCPNCHWEFDNGSLTLP